MKADNRQTGWGSAVPPTVESLKLWGHLDVGSAFRVEGWVVANNDPATRRRLAILVDGKEIDEVIAGEFRKDLKLPEIGLGDGCYAFFYRMPAVASGEHVVQVVDAETGYELQGSPKSFLAQDPTSEERARWARDERDAELRNQALLEFKAGYQRRLGSGYGALIRSPFGLPLRALLAHRRRAETRRAKRIIAASGLFDGDWYVQRHPEAHGDPIRHYLEIGVFNAADPHPLFDTDWYIAQYCEELRDGTNPLVHYLSGGAAAGRSPHPLLDRLHDPVDEIFRHRERERRLRRLANPDVDDLRSKLWGGFSQTGERELERLVRRHTTLPYARGRAAFELACWHLWKGEAARALGWIRAAREHSSELMRELRPRLLEITVLTACGEFEQAEAYIEQARGSESAGPHAVLALCNLIGKRGDDGVAECIAAHLNELYRASGLVEIDIGGDARPEFTAVTGRLDPGLHYVEAEPKISVLTAAYNAAAFIEPCVKSMLGQSWRNCEFVIVDDCSQDGTWEILQDLAGRDKRLKVYRNDTNLGAYGTRNRALELSTGDIVTTHDSDDWSHPQMLEVQLRALLDDTSVRGTFSMMCRATENLVFQLRPHRTMLEFIHPSYPSLMMRRADLLALGCWDGVAVNADDELVQRARRAYGEEAFIQVEPRVPLSIFLTREDCLTERGDTSLRSLSFGGRQEYARSAQHWRWSQLGEDQGVLALGQRRDKKRPFPCPEVLLPAACRTSRQYDMVLVSDLSLLGGTRSCNLAYIQAALAEGLRVGLFHWPRADLRLLADINAAYRELSCHESCDVVTIEEEIWCETVLVHHPPILGHELDAVPTITARRLLVLVNQLPMQLWQQGDLFYSLESASVLLQRKFGLMPEWISISPLVRRVLGEKGALARDRLYRLSDEIWYPPLTDGFGEVIRHRARDRSAQPVLGRHGRDHWTKWPATAAEVRTAYLAGSPYQFRVLGGAAGAFQLVGEQPDNWTVLEFDSLTVEEFLEDIDILVNFNHPAYIEEFGRNVAEAMAAGVPVIASVAFAETFGQAVVACRPEEVAAKVAELWHNRELFDDMVERGLAFVQAHCQAPLAVARMRALRRRDEADLNQVAGT